MTRRVDVVVIGGGQAGLAISHYLTQQGRDHVVLEQATQVGSAWRDRDAGTPSPWSRPTGRFGCRASHIAGTIPTNFAIKKARFDPILGQNKGTDRQRTFTGAKPNSPSGEGQEVTLEKDFIRPTGGGYFFMPSIHAIQTVLAKVDEEPGAKAA